MRQQATENTAPEADQHLEEKIRQLAYHLWETEGRQEGGADEYWHRARERIEAETHASYPPRESSGHRT